MKYVELMSFWHWWIFALVLLILEAFAPGAFFLWMAAAAAVVGVLVLATPDLSWQAQWLSFAVLSVLTIVIWRLYRRNKPVVTDQPALNRRGEQLIGRLVTLDEPIVNGVGKININDTTWKVRGADVAKGAQVKITGVDGTVLLVKAS